MKIIIYWNTNLLLYHSRMTTLYCVKAPSYNAIKAMVTDSTYLYKWNDDNEDNNNYKIILNSSKDSSNSSYSSKQQSRSYTGFHTSVKFTH